MLSSLVHEGHTIMSKIRHVTCICEFLHVKNTVFYIKYINYLLVMMKNTVITSCASFFM